jgi:phage shock protein PspC (stress-responsive transcriptional regulator)
MLFSPSHAISERTIDEFGLRSCSSCVVRSGVPSGAHASPASHPDFWNHLAFQTHLLVGLAMDPKKPIRRSATDRMLGGVLAGIAGWLGCDASVTRVAYILVTAFTGFVLGVAAYAILWVFLPVAGADSAAVVPRASEEEAAR